MHVFTYIFLFIHSLTAQLLWLFIVIKKLQNFCRDQAEAGNGATVSTVGGSNPLEAWGVSV